MRPEGGPQLRDDSRQRPLEIAILALSEPEAGHVDGGAKAAIVAIHLRERLALVGAEDGTCQAGTKLVETSGNRVPLQRCHARRHRQRSGHRASVHSPVSRMVMLTLPGGRPKPCGAVPSSTLGTP